MATKIETTDDIFTGVEQPATEEPTEVFANVQSGKPEELPAGLEKPEDDLLPTVIRYQPRGKKRTVDIGKNALAGTLWEFRYQPIDAATGQPALKEDGSRRTVSRTWKEFRQEYRTRTLSSKRRLRALGAAVGADFVCSQCTDQDGNPNCGPHSSEVQNMVDKAEQIVRGYLSAHPEEAIEFANKVLAARAAREVAKAEATAEA